MNNDDLFKLLPLVGLRPGMDKMDKDLWDKLVNMKRYAKMTNEKLRYACILYFKARYDRSIYESTWVDADTEYKLERAELYKRLAKELLGLYANQEVINSEIGLSLTYTERPNAERGSRSKISAGTWKDGKMYLPGFGGGKGKFVYPHEYFRDRPIQYLIGYWNGKTGKLDTPRAELIHTQVCDDVIKDVEMKFNITFPYEIRSRLSVNSFVKRNR